MATRTYTRSATPNKPSAPAGSIEAGFPNTGAPFLRSVFGRDEPPRGGNPDRPNVEKKALAFNRLGRNASQICASHWGISQIFRKFVRL